MSRHIEFDFIYDINSATPLEMKLEKFLEIRIPSELRETARKEIDRKFGFAKDNHIKDISLLFSLESKHIVKGKLDENMLKTSFKTIDTREAEKIHHILRRKNNLD